MDTHHIPFLELLNGQVQYVVPRWQRRYSWGQREIERLVEDLMTVATAGSDAGHYGGTLLTFPEPGAAGVVRTIRVVDGQQRLTTVSILLAAISERLGPDGDSDGWTAEIIRTDRLTNPGKRPDQIRKLRLQGGDEDEYRKVLAGDGDGAGAVTQAWRTIRRLVAQNDVGGLLRGLQRLRVVSIGLDANEDPQQIFESLNATGRPLTESEKVKNWLLMGLPDALQQELHDDVWLAIEKTLGAEHATERIDEFLRDLLRWRTGRIQGVDAVYDGLRRWAVRGGNASDRPKLCRELAQLAHHYGLLTGTAGKHPDRRVERELRHLRTVGIDVHRPLTMRLLHDAKERSAANAELADVLGLVGAWITRMWLADRPLAGLNKAVAELANGSGPGEGEDLAGHWRGRIDRLRNSRVGVPHDEAVAEGIRTRKAYGGSATRTSFAVLCAMMEAESREEAPARDPLTLEHVMPQKLTQEWRRALGDSAEDVHGAYRDRLANLTLSGDATNAGLGTRPFVEKADIYRDSPIGMTRRVASEAEWNEEALERRAEQLASEALNLWPWESASQTASEQTPFKWRIDGGEWRMADTGSGLVLDVAAALLAQDPQNVERLSGGTLSRDLQPASRFPPNSKAGTLTLRAVPGRDDVVIYPYGSNYPESAERCRQMGARCGVDVEVLLANENRTAAFWRFFKERTGGVPGQKDSWRGPSQWTSTLNADGDRVGIYVGNEELVWLYIRSGLGAERASERAARMRHYSWLIQQTLGDQQLGDNLDKNAEDGTSITVQRSWVRDDEDEWAEVAVWIKDQQERLAAVLGSD
ncbi:MAG: DUF262 domain-containing HNH endonuclease family protein [Gammaproteobacteria bacterium]|nr:DUF262 domain-containing HNH endonuclease family protein [Gammaproteobacteria bacterium]